MVEDEFKLEWMKKEDKEKKEDDFNLLDWYWR